MSVKSGSLAMFIAILFVYPQTDAGQEPRSKLQEPKSRGSKSATSSPDEEQKQADSSTEKPSEDDADSFRLEPGSRRQPDAYWKKKTPGMTFKVMRQHGTESKFSGKYTNSKQKGIFRCAGCGAVLFSSDQKFDSRTGWPSFWAPLAPANVGESIDNSLPTETRTEVHCAACGGHLGHVFSDGPKPTGLRYCLNSVALKLDDSDKAKKLMKEGPQSTAKDREKQNRQQ